MSKNNVALRSAHIGSMVCGLVINRLVKNIFMDFNFKYLYYTSVRSSSNVLLIYPYCAASHIHQIMVIFRVNGKSFIQQQRQSVLAVNWNLPNQQAGSCSNEITALQNRRTSLDILQDRLRPCPGVWAEVTGAADFIIARHRSSFVPTASPNTQEHPASVLTQSKEKRHRVRSHKHHTNLENPSVSPVPSVFITSSSQPVLSVDETKMTELSLLRVT